MAVARYVSVVRASGWFVAGEGMGMSVCRVARREIAGETSREERKVER